MALPSQEGDTVKKTANKSSFIVHTEVRKIICKSLSKSHSMMKTGILQTAVMSPKGHEIHYRKMKTGLGI